MEDVVGNGGGNSSGHKYMQTVVAEAAPTTPTSSTPGALPPSGAQPGTVTIASIEESAKYGTNNAAAGNCHMGSDVDGTMKQQHQQQQQQMHAHQQLHHQQQQQHHTSQYATSTVGGVCHSSSVVDDVGIVAADNNGLTTVIKSEDSVGSVGGGVGGIGAGISHSYVLPPFLH